METARLRCLSCFQLSVGSVYDSVMRKVEVDIVGMLQSECAFSCKTIESGYESLAVALFTHTNLSTFIVILLLF